MKTKIELLRDSPIAAAVALIGSKWRILIIKNLLEKPLRFNELQKSVDGISHKVLTESLRSMKSDGIVMRREYAEVPPRVEYSLTELGESMRPVIDAIESWGKAYKNGFM